MFLLNAIRILNRFFEGSLKGTEWFETESGFLFKPRGYLAKTGTRCTVSQGIFFIPPDPGPNFGISVQSRATPFTKLGKNKPQLEYPLYFNGTPLSPSVVPVVPPGYISYFIGKQIQEFVSFFISFLFSVEN